MVPLASPKARFLFVSNWYPKSRLRSYQRLWEIKMATNKQRLEWLESSMVEIKNYIQQLVEIVVDQATKSKKHRKKQKGEGNQESTSSGSSSISESTNDQSSESDDSVRSPISTRRQDKGRHGPFRMEVL